MVRAVCQSPPCWNFESAAASWPDRRFVLRRQSMEIFVKADEIKKLDAYFKRTFNPTMAVKARPRKDDSAEVYVGDEFLGVVFKDDEDGDLSYNFSMAILDVDL